MVKKRRSLLFRLSGIAVLMFVSGCAAAYHDYQDCCVPYLYCVPPPLPYLGYEGCHCPTPGASGYFRQNGAPGPAIADPDVPTEGPTPEPPMAK